MKKAIKFKTNIKCMGCVAAVTPALNQTVGQDKWSVDLQSPDRELTVEMEDGAAEPVVAALAAVGYQAEPV